MSLLRRALMAASMQSGGEGNLITFYIRNVEAHAEEGMTFGDWIFSDYFDTNNPYGINGANPYVDIRDFFEEYGEQYPEIISDNGMPFYPRLFIYNTITPNYKYEIMQFNPDGY